jgi:tetratricopeptide (TPR) repeat protein
MQQINGGNDPSGAAALYKKVIAALPNSAEAHLRLSEAMLEANDIEGALAPAKKAAELAPKSGEAATNLALIELAIARRSRQNFGAAKTAMSNAAKLSPDDPELWYYLAGLCESTQDSQGALNAWIRLGRLRPPMNMGSQPVATMAYERAASLAYSLKLYNEQREACLALAQEPNASEQHLRMLEELAHVQVAQGYLGHAEESFAILAKRFAEEPSVWQNIALVQRQTDRFEEAIQNLAKAEALKPEPRNTIQQAYCLMSLGRLEEARFILQGLLDSPGLAKNDGLLEHIRGFFASCLLLLNRQDELLQAMAQWSGIPEHPLLLRQRARALLQANDLKTARTALKEGMKRFPEQLIFKLASEIPNNIFEGRLTNSAESRKALRLIELKATAYLWAEFRQWDKCLETIQEVNKAASAHDVELLLLQSNAMESLGQSDGALDALRLCQRLAPGLSIVQNNLGYHLLEFDGDIPEAASLIKAALDQEPDNSSYLDSWGWALFKQGKFVEAEAALQKAADINPLSPETRKHLGEALLKLGRPQEALEQWERALAFAFSGRKNLEDQIAKLKTELAKKALEDSGRDKDPDGPDNSNDYDEGWQP